MALGVGLLVLVLVQLLLGVQCVTYEVFADDKSLFLGCDREENMGNTKVSDIVDMRNMSFVLGKDYKTIYISGDVVIKKSLPNLPIKMEVTVKRWERGQWEQTIIAIKRDDFCKSLNNPFEFWHMFLITNIPKEQRKCPPTLGHVYALRNVSNRMRLEHLPRWDIEGDLKAVLHFSVGNLTACLVVFTTIAIV